MAWRILGAQIGGTYHVYIYIIYNIYIYIYIRSRFGDPPSSPMVMVPPAPCGCGPVGSIGSHGSPPLSPVNGSWVYIVSPPVGCL